MQNKSVFLVFSISIVASLKAQQEPYYTHFAFNKVLYNPAYAGSSGGIELSLIHHRQWLDLRDQTGEYRTLSGLTPIGSSNIAPVTSGFSLSAPLGIVCIKNHPVNIGGFYVAAISDKIAYESNTYLKLGYSVAIPLANQGSLRVGIDFTNLSKHWDAAKFRAMDMPDPLLPAGSNPSDAHWLLGGGLYLKLPAWHDFYAGASVSTFKQVGFSYLNMVHQNTIVQAVPHFYFVCGGKFDKLFHNPLWSLSPNLMVKSVNAGNGWVKPQLDLQGLLNYRNLVSAGAGFRTYITGADAAYLMMGIFPTEVLKIKNVSGTFLRIGYAYDFTLQSLRLSSANTGELQVNMIYPIKEKEKCQCKVDESRHVAPDYDGTRI